jgi:diadenosine tetraphosphatase ApaH/serine/threonine PP2A family protein phosphatase
MLALLYDIHGNVRALDAVLRDVAQQGAAEYFVGGDVALFGPWPEATVERLRALEPATWIRGNGERWTAAPDDLPAPQRAAAHASREALGEALVAEFGALPESAPLDDRTRAWHGSPLSDVRSFTPEPGDDEAELLDGATEARLVFGHTHVQFRRAAAVGDIELINPGSVGMPFDGDHRAAYALLRDDGTIEHRRVAYDHEAVPAALRERYGDAAWIDPPLYRLTHARPGPP